MNEQLCELLKIALQNPEGSPERDRAAEALALMVDQLPEPKIYLNKGKFNLRYYEEALRKYTEPDIKKNIHKFIYEFQKKYQLNIEKLDCKNPKNSQLIRQKFVYWVMMILNCDYRDIYYKYNPKPQKDNKNNINDEKLKSRTIKTNKSSIREISIYKQIGENESFTIIDTVSCPRLYGLGLMLEKELKQIARTLKDQIEEDSENKFKNCHIENREDCNCQTLIKLRYLKEPPLKLREIQEQLNLPVTTIDGHLKRKCILLLREIAKELGYE